MKRNKTGFLAVILSFVSVFSFAYEMDIPKRYFELGFDTEFGLSNNYFAAKELLVKNLDIDLTKISNDIGKDGLVFNLLGNGTFVSNLYLDNGMTFSLSAGVDCSGYGSLSKDLFDFLGKGNDMNENITIGGDGSADAFGCIDTFYQFDWGDFGVSFGAGLFVPLMHVEFDDFKGNFSNGKDGSVDMKVRGTLKAYGCGNLKNVFDDMKINEFMNDLNNGWGFDMSGSVEHSLLNTLQGRAYIRIPVVPGYLDNSMSAALTTGFHANSFFDLASGDGEYEKFELSDKNYGTDRYYLSRPFRTGAEIKWRPFGRYVSFNHMLGIGVKYPWTSQAKAYVEYNFGVDASVFNIIGINLSSSYEREVFIQKAGIMLNFRVLEFDIGASLQGASFAKSWLGSGAGAYLNFRIGW